MPARAIMANGNFRYYLALMGGGLIALGGAFDITRIEYWAGVTTLLGLAVADMVKHRTD